MEYRKIADTGVEVSPIAIGCWQFGDPEWGQMEQHEAERAVREALHRGINLFDTAEVYGGGRSEEMLGKALRREGQDAIVLSKIRGANLRPEAVRPAVEACLARLGRAELGICLIHFPVDDVPVADTLGALNDLRDAGLVRAIGVSNYIGERLSEALDSGMVDVVENNYSLLWRQMDAGDGQLCQDRNVAVLAYSPLAQGLLTGRFRADQEIPAWHTRAKNRLFHGDAYAKSLEAVGVLNTLRARYGKFSSEIALNWVISRPFITSAIIGCHNFQHVSSGVKALGWEINSEDEALISNAGMKVSDSLDTSLPVWETQPPIEHARE
jgi:myo-inositol catabolism protein IolS